MHNVKWRLPGLGPLIPGLLSLLLFCSCATTWQSSDNRSAAPLPADTTFNKGAGRGNHLYLTLHLENGEKLLFMVDNGCPGTVLDKSLEPKLGKRLSSTLLWYSYYGLRGLTRVNVYHAPELYLGNTRLMKSDRVYTDDLRTKSWLGRPIMGILGMDCLKHYCLQLDFEADTIHFLDPDQPKTEGLGQALPLIIDNTGGVSIHAGFFGITNAGIGLDTGDSSDGALSAGLFNKELKKQKPSLTNQWRALSGGLNARVARFPEAEFCSQTYSDLVLHKHPLMPRLEGSGNIGLRFLARHLVTFNFPKRMLYLQRRSVGPLPDSMAALKETFGFVNDQPPKDLEARVQAFAKERPGGRLCLDAGEFLKNLKKKGQLPGWSKKDTGNQEIWLDPDLALEWERVIQPEDYPAAQTLTLFRKGDTSTYNYTVVQESPGAPWQLQRAWKAAPNGHILKDYSIHGTTGQSAAGEGTAGSPPCAP
jgi:hypothetical protein